MVKEYGLIIYVNVRVQWWDIVNTVVKLKFLDLLSDW